MQKQIPIRTRKNVFNDSEECIAKLEFALVAGTTLLRTFKEPLNLNVHWHLQTLAHHFSLSHWQSETGSQSKTRSTVTKTISLVPECNNRNPPPKKNMLKIHTPPNHKTIKQWVQLGTTKPGVWPHLTTCYMVSHLISMMMRTILALNLPSEVGECIIHHHHHYSACTISA